MFWNVILLVIFIVWIMLFIKNRKTILSLPYLLMIFITPIYNILDSRIFVEIFGCGCVPYTQTNMLNIAFNANDLRIVVYNVIVIIMTILGIVLSRKFENKKSKLIYVVTIILVNLLLAAYICSLGMWL